jgi:hypothetical protein
MAIRYMMDTLNDYSTACKWLHRIPLMAPAYILMCGINNTEAQLITRCETVELQRQTIGHSSTVSSSSSSRKETKSSAKKASNNSSSSSNNNTNNSTPLITTAPYLVQANMDHWISSKKLDIQDSLARSNACHSQLSRAPANVTLADGTTLLWRLLCHPSIWDDQTIYGTIMCPAVSAYTTVIEAPFPAPSSSKQSKNKSKKKR